VYLIKFGDGLSRFIETATTNNPKTMERRTFKRGLMTRAQMKERLKYSLKPQNDQLWVWWLSPVAVVFKWSYVGGHDEYSKRTTMMLLKNVVN
jgi:hypothetical protein